MLPLMYFMSLLKQQMRQHLLVLLGKRLRAGGSVVLLEAARALQEREGEMHGYSEGEFRLFVLLGRVEKKGKAEIELKTANAKIEKEKRSKGRKQ